MQPVHAVRHGRARQHIQHHKRRNELRDHRRVGDALDLPVILRHKENIQHGIDDRCDNQEDQRPERIAHGAQDARADVVQKHARNAPEVDAQIAIRHLVHLRGLLHFHDFQKQRHRQVAQKRAYDARHQRHDHGRLHRVGQLSIVLRAAVLRNDHARAGRDADEEWH